jgi:hypothetical protein
VAELWELPYKNRKFILGILSLQSAQNVRAEKQYFDNTITDYSCADHAEGLGTTSPLA